MSDLFELKTTEAAAYMLKKAGGRMSYLKLIKLLYLSDREAIKTIGLPITFDDYCSMKNGPVLSRTYDWIKGNIHPGYGEIWQKVIQTSRYDVLTVAEKGNPHLSEAELAVLDKIYSKYSRFDRFELVEITHKLPEYTEPLINTSIPIEISEVIYAVEEDGQERKRIEEEITLYKTLNA